jgi:hypothetical protein
MRYAAVPRDIRKTLTYAETRLKYPPTPQMLKDEADTLRELNDGQGHSLESLSQLKTRKDTLHRLLNLRQITTWKKKGVRMYRIRRG